jgi:rfaE bifunctional protein kinase chain/domain/rfaE bifunctional protein nucleotidyltransferase chain/domain
MSNKKIFSLDNLIKKISKDKKKGKKIVLCHGTFDLLHIGHIKYFKQAKTFGDKLIVTVTSDKYVNKGPNRPAFGEKYRMESIAALETVDFVSLSDNPTAIQIIKSLKPDFYCKGPDYKNYKNDTTGAILDEIKMTKKFGGRIVYTKDITFSSSKVINSFSNAYSLEQKKTFQKIKEKYNFSKIKYLVEKIKDIKVLVIGEIIIDQYVFCEALGKSGKEPVLALRDIRSEQYLGGAAAICRHLSQFCGKISLLSAIGEKGEYLKEIKKGLPKNVNFKYFRKKKSPTIVKKRFLDNISLNKVLGVYSINDDLLSSTQEKKFINLLKKFISFHDLVIVSDYGHGLISEKISKIISNSSKYVALNAQINASNVGYHTMKNYKNIDCVIINQKELQHEMRDRNSKIEILMNKLSSQQKIKDLVVTRGIDGSLLYNKEMNKFNICQAFTKSPVDKIGTGDAMLSIIALFLKSGFTKDLALLAGSLAASQSASTIGNKYAVDKTKILKSLEHLLK